MGPFDKIVAEMGLDAPPSIPPDPSGLTWRDLPTSQAGASWKSGVAGWQARYGHLAAALGMDNAEWLARKEAEQRFYQQNAPGATSFQQVLDGGKLSDYITYLLVSSIPDSLEMLAGGVTGGLARGAARGVVNAVGKDAVAEAAAQRLATQGAITTAAAEREALAKAADKVAMGYAAGTGGALASYPSAVGDILSNQMDEGGPYRFGPAAALAVPYALFNLLGMGGTILRGATGSMRRAAVNAGKGGIRDALVDNPLTRMGKTAVVTGAGESVGETGQEVLNQLGRMTVNPEATLTSGDAWNRYMESAAGGFFSGGPVGGAAHVFSKPRLANTEEVAQRIEGLKDSMDNIRRGHETWLDVKERTAQEVEAQKKLDEQNEKDAYQREQDAREQNQQAIDNALELYKIQLEQPKQVETTAPVAGTSIRIDPLTGTYYTPNSKTLDETIPLGRPTIPTVTPTGKMATQVGAGFTPHPADLLSALGPLGWGGMYSQNSLIGVPFEAKPEEETTPVDTISRALDLNDTTGIRSAGHVAEDFANNLPRTREIVQSVVGAVQVQRIGAGEKPYSGVSLSHLQQIATDLATGTPEQQAALMGEISYDGNQSKIAAQVSAVLPQIRRAFDLGITTTPVETAGGSLGYLSSIAKQLIAKNQQANNERIAARATNATREQTLNNLFDSLDKSAYTIANMNSELRKAGIPTLNPTETKLYRRRATAYSTLSTLQEPIVQEQQPRGRQYGGTGLFRLGEQEIQHQPVNMAPARFQAYRAMFRDYLRATAVGDKQAAIEVVRQVQDTFSEAETKQFSEMLSAPEGQTEFDFTQPKKVRKPRAAKTTETKQAEPQAAQAGETAAPTVTAGAIKALAQKFNGRNTLTLDEAQRTLAEEAAQTQAQEKPNGEESTKAGQTPAQEIPNANEGQNALLTKEKTSGLQKERKGRKGQEVIPETPAAQAETPPVPAASAEALNNQELSILPEIEARWNTRKETRTGVEKAAAKGDEIRFARDYNTNFADKFPYVALDRDLQLLAKRAYEKAGKSALTGDLVDRIEQVQDLRDNENAEAKDEAKQKETVEPVDTTPTVGQPTAPQSDAAALEAFSRAIAAARKLDTSKAPMPADTSWASAAPTAQENPDAVQKQSTAEVDVRKEADNGETVGKRNTKPEKPASESKSKKEVTTQGAVDLKAMTDEALVQRRKDLSNQIDTLDADDPTADGKIRVLEAQLKRTRDELGSRTAITPEEDTADGANAAIERDTNTETRVTGTESAIAKEDNNQNYDGTWFDPMNVLYRDINVVNPDLEAALPKINNVGELLDFLLGQSKNDGVSALVQDMLDSVAGIRDVKVKYINEIKYNEGDTRKAGEYNGNIDTVFIYRGGETDHTALHEILHSVTAHHLVEGLWLSDRVAKGAKTDNFTDEQRRIFRAYRTLEQLFEETKAAIEQDTAHAEKLNKTSPGKYTAPSFYGMKSLTEFVAEAYTNAEFQRYLRSVTSKVVPSLKPSLWKRVSDAFYSMIGLTKPQLKSVYARLIEITPELLSTKESAKFRYLGTYNNVLSLNPNEPHAFPVLDPDLRAVVGEAPTLQKGDYRGRREFELRNLATKTKAIVKAGLDQFITMRQLGRRHPKLANIIRMAQQMMQRKQTVLTIVNHRFREYLRGQNILSFGKDAVSAAGRAANAMLAGTMERFADGLPAHISSLATEYALRHMDAPSGDTRSSIFTYGKNGELKLNKELSGMDDEGNLLNTKGGLYLKHGGELAAKWLLSKEDFAKGVYLTSSQNELSLEALFKKHGLALTKENIDAAYLQYKAAMEAVLQLKLQKLHSMELYSQGVTQKAETELEKEYTGEALVNMKRFRQLHSEMYKRTSEIDLNKRKAMQIDPDTEAKWDRMKTTLHGMVRDKIFEGSREFDDLAKEYGLTPAQMTTLLKPLIAELKRDIYKDDKVKVYSMVEQIIAGAQSVRLNEDAAYTAMEEILGMYLPDRRDSKYLARMKLIDITTGEHLVGGVIKKTATGADVQKDSTGALAVVMHDEVERLQDFVDAENKKLKAEGKTVTVFVKQYDENGELIKDGDGNEVTKPTEARIEWLAPTRVDEGASVAMRMTPMQLFTTMEMMGIPVKFKDRETIIKATTNAGAAMRHSGLHRDFNPGYSTDYAKVLSDYIGSGASHIAINEYGHKLQMEASKKAADWDWTTTGVNNDEEQLKNKEEALKKATNADMKMRLTRERDALLTRKNNTDPAINKWYAREKAAIQQEAIDYVQYILGQDQLEERSSVATKFRAATMIGQLGGTFASAFTNLSSIPLHGFSWLVSYNPDHAYGGGFKASAAASALAGAARTLAPLMLKNVRPFFDWKNDPSFDSEAYFAGKVEAAKANGGTFEGHSAAAWEFLRKAAAEDLIGAQKYNELLALRKHSQFGPRISKAISHYMSLFSATEAYNRSVVGLAAFELFYKENIQSGMPEQEAADRAYTRAEDAINDTQGSYTMVTRPKMFRSDVGALIFLYETFVVNTLEMIKNLPASGRAVFLGSLSVVSGVGGLPFFEELMTVLDVASQKTGVGLGITHGSAEKAFVRLARDFGEAMGLPGLDKAAMYGILDAVLGTDVFGRAGIHVGVPGFNMLRPGADFWRELGRSSGAVSGAIEGTLRASGEVMRGDMLGAVRAAPVSLARNLADAYAYAKFDNVMNKRGQVVGPADTQDIVARVLGFYPEKLQQVNASVRREEYQKAFAKELRAQVIEQYREAYVLRDSAAMNEIRMMVQEHNANFRGTPLEIENFAAAAERAGKEARMTLAERIYRSQSKAAKTESELEPEGWQ